MGVKNMYYPDEATHRNQRVRPQFANIEPDPAVVPTGQTVDHMRFRIVEHKIDFSVNPPVHVVSIPQIQLMNPARTIKTLSNLTLDEADTWYRQLFTAGGSNDAY